LLDLGILVTTLFAAESHDNDFFEEWDRGNAHLALTISKACVALGREFNGLLFDIADLVCFVVHWFAEIHVIGRNFWIGVPVGVSLNLGQ
jgi:hypothetical protein